MLTIILAAWLGGALGHMSDVADMTDPGDWGRALLWPWHFALGVKDAIGKLRGH